MADFLKEAEITPHALGPPGPGRINRCVVGAASAAMRSHLPSRRRRINRLEQTLALRAMLTASFILLAVAGAAVAGPLEDGRTAAEKGDYATAYRLWRPLAEQGDPRAQLFIGLMHSEGKGVSQNYSEAVNWFRKAAAQGSLESETALGFMYFNGQGVPQDYAEAAKWYRKAADQGDAHSQGVLGWMYVDGRGVPQDNEAALVWLRKAAGQGDAYAERNWHSFIQRAGASP